MAPGEEPKSWSDYLNNYRRAFGSQSYATAASAGPQVRFTRSVPGICPLAEIKHPLYATGSNQHTLSSADGSLQRAQWHGWGDVSLLKEDGFQGVHRHCASAHQAEGKKIVAAPVGRDGRHGLFGLLQGTEAGGSDAWLGNLHIDPTKGKRSVAAPTDNKRTVSFSQMLAQTTPGRPAEDAWLGNISIDPAKGKGHAPDPSQLRGRTDLFAVIQHDVLRQDGRNSSSDSTAAGEADAWIGNRMIEPNKGKKRVELSEPCKDHLFAATFKSGPAPDGCWCDMPPVGKRPLSPPSNAAGFINAAQTMRIYDPVPSGTVIGSGKPHGKAIVPDPHNDSSKPEHVDMYKLMTFQPLSQGEADRYHYAWNDATRYSRKKAVSSSSPATSDSMRFEWQPNKATGMRYVPYGGIAQEAGMTLNTIITNRNQFERAFGGTGTGSRTTTGQTQQNRAKQNQGSANGGRTTTSKR